MVRDALYAPAAKERGLFRPDAVDALLADPNGRLTPLRGNELWQIGLLELWLQKHGITGPRRDARPTPRNARPRPSPSGCTTRRPNTWSTRWPTTSCSNWAGADWFSARLRRSRTSSPRCLRGESARPPRHLHVRPRATRSRRPGARRTLHRSRATPTGCGSPRTTNPRLRRPGSRCARCSSPEDADDDQPRLRAVRDGARPGRRHLGQPAAQRCGRLPGRRARRRRQRRGHGDRRRPRAVVRRPGERLEPVDAGRRPDVEPARCRRGADPRARRRFPRTRPRIHGSLGGARQRGRHRPLREAGLRSGFRCWRSSARTRSTSRCSPTRRKRSTISIRTRGSSPTKPCGAVSGSRCSTPKPARCGCRTAAAASSPESRCRSTPPRSR